MPITWASLTSGSDTTDGTSFVTASITPTNGRLVLVGVMSNRGLTPPGTVTIAADGLPTPTEIATQTFATIASPLYRVTLFRAVGNGTAGAVTITTSVASQFASWSIAEFIDVDQTTNQGVVQSAVDAVNSPATSLTVTLGAFASSANATYGFLGHPSTGVITPGAGFSEIHQVTSVTPDSVVISEFRDDNDTTVDASIPAGRAWGGIAVELAYIPSFDGFLQPLPYAMFTGFSGASGRAVTPPPHSRTTRR